MKAFITVIGKDKVGIIYKITSVLFENNINILDINLLCKKSKLECEQYDKYQKHNGNNKYDR